jgi:nucleotide-binding universal stress UspA family protein
MLPIRTILHPTDFSEHSNHAFRLACSLARDHGARLIVLHIVERTTPVYSGVMTPMPPMPLSAEERRAVRERLEHIKPPDSKVLVEYVLEEGDPATVILQVAQQRQCQLIVLGSHGRTGLSRLLMGSVAEKIVRLAPCPVLTVKTPHHPAPTTEEAITPASRHELETG